MLNENINRRILVIDDNEAIHEDFRVILGNSGGEIVNVTDQEGVIFGASSKFKDKQFEINSALQGQEGIEKARQAVEEGKPYAMAFIDVRMPPGMDGIETTKQIWKEDPHIQIVLCTAYSDYSWHDMIKELGETDQLLILKKPFDVIEVRQISCSITQKWNLLNNMSLLIKEQTKEVVETRDLTIFALAKLAESRDPETGEHLERLRSYTRILAEQLAHNSPYKNKITEKFLNDIYKSSPLHDIGKVGIPDTILLKPSHLNTDEFEIMKRHTLIGEDAIASVAQHSGYGSFLDMAAKIARNHHERFDGTGYPDGLKGKDIPLAARIVTLADVFDAITSVRVYKTASDPTTAKSIIENEAGKHFDPIIVEAMQACWGNFMNVYEVINNSATKSIRDEEIDNILR